MGQSGQGTGEILSAFGGITAAYGQYAAGRMNASALRFNAKMDELKARDAMRRGKTEAEQALSENRQLIGAQRVAAAGQNIDVNTGTAELLQEQAAYQGELDAMTIRNNAMREAFGYKLSATNDRLKAGISKLSGDTGAAGTLLSTAGKASSSAGY